MKTNGTKKKMRRNKNMYWKPIVRIAVLAISIAAELLLARRKGGTA